MRSAFRKGVGAASRGESVAAPAAQMKSGDEARVEAIRKNPDYRRGNKALAAEMASIMARLHPGME